MSTAETEALAKALHGTIFSYDMEAAEFWAPDLEQRLAALGYSIVPVAEQAAFQPMVDALHEIADLLSIDHDSGDFPSGEAMVQAWNVAIRVLALPHAAARAATP